MVIDWSTSTRAKFYVFSLFSPGKEHDEDADMEYLSHLHISEVIDNNETVRREETIEMRSSCPIRGPHQVEEMNMDQIEADEIPRILFLCLSFAMKFLFFI